MSSEGYMRKMSKMIQLSESDAVFQDREGQEEKQMGEKDVWWGGGWISMFRQTFGKQPGREGE